MACWWLRDFDGPIVKVNTSEGNWHGVFFFFFQAEDGIRDSSVTGVQTCALPIFEPWMSKQWFVKTGPMAEKVIAKVDDMRFVPENWRAEFLRWMNNIHDWCISRQLWWG